MNRRLTDHQIRTTCHDLLAQHGPAITGRYLRRTLRQRYGAVGKTERVFGIWRELAQRLPRTSSGLATNTAGLHARLTAAETAAAEATARAELSALREQAHQDKWAAQIDQLRQQLAAQPGTFAQIHTLQDQVQRLSMELMSARAMLARYEEANELLKP